MGLSYDIISQFAKVVQKDKKHESESTVYGKVIVDESGNKYVQLDGSDQLTPLDMPSVDFSTATVNDGDRVSVLIKNHTATVTGNLTAPSVGSGDVTSEIQKFNNVVVDQVNANTAYIQELQSGKASIGDLEAAEAEIDILKATKVSTDEFNAVTADVTDLKAVKMDADVANAKFATIEKLNATDAEIDQLEASHAKFESTVTNDISAINAIIQNANLESLNATYANIDFSNIGKAAMEYFYSQSGLIENVVVGDQTITGKLVGVTISGDLFEAGTVKADKLVIKGNDGLYYKLNTDGVKIEAQQTDYNSINGQVIKAKSITATKINVDDLVAFDATIGGFNISDSSIYSGTKNTVNNTTRGIYLDKDGQIAIGDNTSFLKYYKDTDGSYKLEIASKSIDNAAKTATNFLNYDSTNGLQIGNRSSGSWSGFRTRITNATFDILNKAGTVLASYGEKLIELGKNATDAVIKFCGGKGRIEYDSTDKALQLTGDNVRLKGTTMASVYSKHYDGASTARASSVNVSPDRVDIFSQDSNDIDPTTQVGTYRTSEVSVTPEGVNTLGDDISIIGRNSVDITSMGDKPVTFDGKTLVDLIYPVGSIYMSVTYFDPATVFGGTWERLMDRFLLGSGATYASGTTGGEAKHTLTVSEMPKHQHAIGYANTGGLVTLNSNNTQGNYLLPWEANKGYSAADLVALEAGGGTAHNNMPPYLVVNMWKRIA